MKLYIAFHLVVSVVLGRTEYPPHSEVVVNYLDMLKNRDEDIAADAIEIARNLKNMKSGFMPDLESSEVNWLGGSMQSWLLKRNQVFDYEFADAPIFEDKRIGFKKCSTFQKREKLDCLKQLKSFHKFRE